MTKPKPGGYVERRHRRAARPIAQIIRDCARKAIEALEKKNDAEVRVLLQQIRADAAELELSLADTTVPIDERSTQL